MNDELATDGDESRVFNPAERVQNAFAPVRIINLDHKGGHEFLSLRDQRIIGFKLLLDLFRAALRARPWDFGTRGFFLADVFERLRAIFWQKSLLVEAHHLFEEASH
jgi:hypothetical protein